LRVEIISSLLGLPIMVHTLMRHPLASNPAQLRKVSNDSQRWVFTGPAAVGTLAR
jgi:hypothetical protein